MSDINPIRLLLDDMRERITEIDDFLELGIYLRNFSQDLEIIGSGLKMYSNENTSSDGFKAIKDGISRLYRNTVVDMRGMILGDRFVSQKKTANAQEIVNIVQTLDSLLQKLCDKAKDGEPKGMRDCYDEILDKTLEQRSIIHQRARMVVHQLIEFVTKLADQLK